MSRRLIAEPAAALRLVHRAVALYAAVWIVVRWEHLAGRSAPDPSLFRPVGVVALVTDRPVPGWANLAAAMSALGAAGLVVARSRPTATAGGRLAAVVLAGSLLWVATYDSSWGQVFHTENLLVLHAALLAGAGLLDGRTDAAATAADTFAALRLVTVVPYVLAAAAKLRSTGVGWVTGDHLRHWVAFDNLRKAELGDRTSPLVDTLVPLTWPWPALAALTLVVEAGAVVALVSRRLAAGWAAAAWAFHVGVLAVMAIGFPYALSGVQFLPFVLPAAWGATAGTNPLTADGGGCSIIRGGWIGPPPRR